MAVRHPRSQVIISFKGHLVSPTRLQTTSGKDMSYFSRQEKYLVNWMNNSSSKLAQRQACSVPSKGPRSRLQGSRAGHWFILAGCPSPYTSPSLPCINILTHLPILTWQTETWQLSTAFLMGCLALSCPEESQQPVPRELLALPQDSHLGKMWLPWCASLECHCAASMS